MKKKLLVLGAGNAQIDLIRYAREKDFEVHAVSYTNTDKGIPIQIKVYRWWIFSSKSIL